MSYEYVGIEVMEKKHTNFKNWSPYTLCWESSLGPVPMGVLFGACTQIALCWRKPKTGALERHNNKRNVLREMRLSTSRNLTKLGSHLNTLPVLAGQFHHRVRVIPNDSKSISLLSPPGIGCQKQKHLRSGNLWAL